MKKRNLQLFAATADVLKIDIEVFNAEVRIVSTSEPRLCMEYSAGLRPAIEEREGAVVLRQGKTLFYRLKHPSLTVHVPECLVPDINITAERGKVTITGGIFGDACVKGKNIHARIDGAAFENLQLKADELDMTADEITVKNVANARAEGGRVMLEGAYCKRADCHVKRGNIGLCGSECDFAILSSDEGNISAIMPGKESDYTLAVSGAALSGAKLSGENTAGAKSLRARAAKGCVLLDYENAPRFDERAELLGDEAAVEQLHA